MRVHLVGGDEGELRGLDEGPIDVPQHTSLVSRDQWRGRHSDGRVQQRGEGQRDDQHEYCK